MSTDVITSSSNPGYPRRYKAMRDGAGAAAISYAPTFSSVQQSMWRTTFAKAIASGVDPEFFTQVGALGTGITYSQTGGNLVINSGATANSELILRSVEAFNGSFEFRWQTILSQRIVNQNFIVELVDVLGDACALTVNSATSITVTIPGIGATFSAANVGQSLSIGAIAGVAAAIPGRYAIASVAGDAINLTVAGWPASGSGTCSVFGWNFYRANFTGATATNINWDAGRRGYASGDTVANIGTSASPGIMGVMQYEGGMAALGSTPVASATNQQFFHAASRVVNVPDENAALFLQIRCLNGSTAPASTTAWTVGMASMLEYYSTPVALANTRGQSNAVPVPVVSAGFGSALAMQGVGGHGTAITGNPVRLGVRALNAAYTAVATGQSADLISTLQGVLVTRPWQIPELEWSYAAAAGGILNTTVAVTIRAAAGAGLRSYITTIQLMAQALTTATELVVRDGASGTVIWRHFIPTSGLSAMQFDFENPLRSTANTLLEVATLTASGAGAVYINVQGFTAA